MHANPHSYYRASLNKLLILLTLLSLLCCCSAVAALLLFLKLGARAHNTINTAVAALLSLKHCYRC